MQKLNSQTTSGLCVRVCVSCVASMYSRVSLVRRGGLGGKSGPGVTVRPAHSIHGALPIQYTARCPLNASHVSTSQWPTWKNAHTLNIILDVYKEMTSYMFFFI